LISLEVAQIIRVRLCLLLFEEARAVEEAVVDMVVVDTGLLIFKTAIEMALMIEMRAAEELVVSLGEAMVEVWAAPESQLILMVAATILMVEILSLPQEEILKLLLKQGQTRNHPLQVIHLWI